MERKTSGGSLEGDPSWITSRARGNTPLNSSGGVVHTDSPDSMSDEEIQFTLCWLVCLACVQVYWKEGQQILPSTYHLSDIRSALSAFIPSCRVWEGSGSPIYSQPHAALPISEVRMYLAEACFSPCLWSQRWGCAWWGAMSQPTPMCELLRSTGINRQGVLRLPTGEGYSGTSSEGRSFLSGCPKEFLRAQTHDLDPVVRNSCLSPARYRRRNLDHGFGEPRRRVSGTPNRTQSIAGLHPNWRRHLYLHRAGYANPLPSVSDTPQ
jgi:hypothetical protein